MEVQGFGRGENSGFPKADTRFWAEENARLRYRLNLLEEYKHINGTGIILHGLYKNVTKLLQGSSFP
jgi:hypothetical protein